MRLPEAKIEQFAGVLVVRDDLLPGGSKTRFLHHLIKGKKEVVFGGPFCGGAPVALAVIGNKLNIKISLFYAKRKVLHLHQKIALKNNARIFQVPYGYMNNVQSKAKKYCEKTGAYFLPLGFDIPQASEPFINEMVKVSKRIGKVHEVWCAVGSGMLARCLGIAFPGAKIKGVQVGLDSRNEKQKYTKNVQLLKCRYKFAQECKSSPPFNSSLNYDSKAWEVLMSGYTRSKKNILFWNVL